MKQLKTFGLLLAFSYGLMLYLALLQTAPGQPLQFHAAVQHGGQRGAQLQGGAFIGKEALPQAGISVARWLSPPPATGPVR